MTSIPEQKALDAPHKITLDARSRLSVTGVLEIESFDDGMIALATTRGPLVIHGQGLHLQELTSGGGEVRVDGTVDSIAYEEAACSADGAAGRTAGRGVRVGGGAGAGARVLV